MSEKICTIICAAPCGELPTEPEGLVIAADGGLDAALAAGITPDIVVGDFDSAEQAVPDGIECIKVSPIKDDTDSRLAAETALKHGCTELRFFRALGGRLDHTIANIQLLYELARRGVPASLCGAGEKAYMVTSGGSVRVRRFEGYLSVFSYGEYAVISEQGVKYPTDKHRFTNAFPLGVSNEITADTALIEVHEGTALIIEEHTAL